MKHLITFFALCLIAALVVVTAGCDDDDDVLDDIIDEEEQSTDDEELNDDDLEIEEEEEEDTDTGEEEEEDTDNEDGSDEGTLKLTKEHPSWAKRSFESCWDEGCHDRETTHYPELKPYECVPCHGTNGALPIFPMLHHPIPTNCLCHTARIANLWPAHYPVEEYPVKSCTVCH